MDTSLFYDVAHIAARTSWADGTVRALAGAAGTLFFVAVTLLSFLRARVGAFGAGGARPIAAVLWTGIAAAASYGVARVLAILLDRTPPGVALARVHVLVAPAGGHSLPTAAAAIGAAVLIGLWIAGDWPAAGLATIGALVVAFACVYDAAAYPGDAAAGLGVGILVTVVGWSLVRAPLTAWMLSLAHSRAGGLIGATAGQEARRSEPGPAAHPSLLNATGAVRLLEDAAVRPVTLTPRLGNANPPVGVSDSSAVRRVIAPPIDRGPAADPIGRRSVTILPRDPD